MKTKTISRTIAQNLKLVVTIRASRSFWQSSMFGPQVQEHVNILFLPFLQLYCTVVWTAQRWTIHVYCTILDYTGFDLGWIGIDWTELYVFQFYSVSFRSECVWGWLRQGSDGHEKSWKVVEFENELSRLGKVMDFRKNGRGNGKIMEFHFFGPNISYCLKTGNILLVIEQKYAPKRAGFSVLFSHWKHKLIMEKSLNFIVQFLCEPCSA